MIIPYYRVWSWGCVQLILPYRVWSWGWGVHGQLGLRSVDDRAVPTHSTLLDNKQVSFIAAGYGHSAILTAGVSVVYRSAREILLDI